MEDIQKYFAPSSLNDALTILTNEETTVFAGGTDLMPQTGSGARKFKPALMNLNHLSELRGIKQDDGYISIGARTTITDILRDPLLREKATVLQQVADCFASGQIRNSATLGGNICNASPAGDMIPPLILLDAELVLVSFSNGAPSERIIAVSDFFTGPGKTTLQPSELLVSIRIRERKGRFVAGFKKFGTRPALDISIVSVGIAGIKENGTLKDVRVAFGAVAPVPLRGKKTESAIDGTKLSDEVIRSIAQSTSDDISPIDDVRSSAWYRTELTRTLTERILRDLDQA